MIGSRFPSLLVRSLRTKRLNKQPSRNAWNEYTGYREPNYQPNMMSQEVLVAIYGGFMWWWLIHNFYHNFHMVVGHFPYAKPAEWTDEELGIPSDDEGLAPVKDYVRTVLAPGAIDRHHNLSPHYMKLKFGDVGMWKF